jgi:hypothetical protein
MAEVWRSEINTRDYSCLSDLFKLHGPAQLKPLEMLAHKSPQPAWSPGLGRTPPEGAATNRPSDRHEEILPGAAFPKIVASSTLCFVIDLSMDADRVVDAFLSGKSFSLPPTFRASASEPRWVKL